MATAKKDGGVRPLAAGEVLRRLAAEVLCTTVRDEALAALWPLQVGVAPKMGTERAVHTARQWAQRHVDIADAVAVKIYFSNAFNTVSRQGALDKVREYFPPRARWCHHCYSHRSFLA